MNWSVISTKTFYSFKIEHSAILASEVAGCILIYAFASLFDIPIGITSPTVELKICTITAGIKKYKSIIKKKKKHNKTVLLAIL